MGNERIGADELDDLLEELAEAWLIGHTVRGDAMDGHVPRVEPVETLRGRIRLKKSSSTLPSLMRTMPIAQGEPRKPLAVSKSTAVKFRPLTRGGRRSDMEPSAESDI